MNTFDEIFVNKVKEVFDNHNEAYQPADWNKLQGKMGKNRRGLIIFLPYIAKAAIVIIFLGLSVFILNNYENDIQYLETAQYIKTDDLPILPNQNTTTIEKNIIDNNYIIEKSKKRNLMVFAKRNNSTDITANNEVVINKKEELVDKEGIVRNMKSVEFINNSHKCQNIELHTEPDLHNIKQLKTSRFTNEKPILQAVEDELEVDNNKQKRFGFGVEIASLSSYSDIGVDNNVNMGAGISASYKLAKNIRFSTGVLIAKQSLNGMVKRRNSDFANNASNKFGINDEVYGELMSDKSQSEILNSANVSNINLHEQKRTFVTVDIPLNIVYKYKKLSFTTGVSSLLHLQEQQNYKYRMSVNNSVYNATTATYDNFSNTTTVSRKKHIATNHFDFAKLINLSVGYGIDMKKGSLTVEPYIKVPIGTLSSQDILMGAGGLALRYNFFK